MMTRFAELIHTIFRKYIALLVLSALISACTMHPDGASSNIDYLPLSDCCGVIVGAQNKNPEFVVSDTFSIPMLVDKRIIGTWSFQEGINNVVLLEDGTATTTTPSMYTRSGQWVWVSGNVILIEYTNGQFDVIRFGLFDDNMGIFRILSHDSYEPKAFIGIKIDNQRARHNGKDL